MRGPTSLAQSSVTLWFHGSKSVGTTAVQLPDQVCYRGVTVFAHPDNTARVAVGNASNLTVDSAESTDGPLLEKKDGIFIEAKNVNKVWVKAAAAGQKIFWVAT